MKETKIFADCYQTSIQVFNRTKNFPKALRPTVGRRLEEASLNCLISIRKATLSTPAMRLKYLHVASESLDEMRTLLQFSKDMGAINVAGFAELSGYTKEIGKELGGFIKYAQQERNTP